MSALLNSTGRTFIRENSCSPFEYSQDCGVEISGVSESFGDVSYYYCESKTEANSYDVVAQVEGTSTPPTTTITAYLPQNGKSQLLKYAKKGCTFDVQIHYGECHSPTDFTTFDYGILLQDVKLTNYSTTNLTSRSPDTRAVIDLTFNASIASTHDLYPPSLAPVTNTLVSTGSVDSIFAYSGDSCTDATCSDDCNIYAVQRNTNTLKFLRRLDGTWIQDDIVSGNTLSTTYESFIYTNGTNMYVIANYESSAIWRIYTASHASAAENQTWTLLTSVSGNMLKDYHVNGSTVYLGTSSGELLSLNTSTSSLTILDTGLGTLTSVFGYGSTVYMLTSSGDVLEYSNSSSATVGSIGVSTGAKPVSVFDENSFIVYSTTGGLYCTTNGGSTFSNIGTMPGSSSVEKFVTSNGVFVIAVTADGNVYESYDSGHSWSSNNTFTLTDFVGHAAALCGDDVYVSGGDSNNIVGHILQST